MATKTIYKNDPYRRRVKIIRISPETMEAILFGDGDIVVKSEVPKDAVITRMYWDDNSGTFDIVIKHKDFQEVLEGEVIPITDQSFKISTVEQYYAHKINKLRE